MKPHNNKSLFLTQSTFRPLKMSPSLQFIRVWEDQPFHSSPLVRLGKKLENHGRIMDFSLFKLMEKNGKVDPPKPLEIGG